MSYTARRKVGDRVYLEERESYRKNGKVKVRFLRYLGVEGETPGKPRPAQHLIDQLRPDGSSRSGDVGLLWALAQDLRIPQTIDRLCPHRSREGEASPGILLTVWAINRVVHPVSATQLERWTPTTDLPRLTGIAPEKFTKDAFLFSLDKVCGENPEAARLVDRTDALEEELYRHWRVTHPLPPGVRETLAYDLTSVLFFGVTCPLAELGYNAKDVEDQVQVNLGLLVNRSDTMPVAHALFEGSRHGVATVRNMLARLSRRPLAPGEEGSRGTLIWDRGMVSGDHVKVVEEMGWQLICGLPKTLNAVQEVLDATEVPARPETLVRQTGVTTVYAVEAERKLFGQERRVVVYFNGARAVREADQRNGELAKITEALGKLSEEGAQWKEAKLHKAIKEIVGRWAPYLEVRVSRQGKGKDLEKGPRVTWSYHQHALRAAERRDGKLALLVTDPKVSTKEAVNTYLEKDFIEKGFRAMKTDEEMEPVRHYRERRVRAYEFVQVLALRLRAALRWSLREEAAKVGRNPWEYEEDLLKTLGRVERVEVALGRERRIWHLNLMKGTRGTLRKIGYGKLFEEKPPSVTTGEGGPPA
jgi:hypothetical protein